MTAKSENKEKKLVLVDGSSYLFRAYHALPPLMTSTGQATGAAYGVINMLRKLIVDEKPDYIAVVFDTKSKNFRHALYPEYKAHRPTMPEELSSQIGPLHEIIGAMGIPLLAIEGMEADDVIATLAHRATLLHLKTVISTGDKDIAQLVDTNVSLVNTMTGSILDINTVKTKFGVTPEQIVDYLTLIGDPVDNVPGIPKVGPKTAVKWLEEYGTLDKIIEQSENIKGKVGEYLRAHLEFLPLGKKLVTVRKDMEITHQPTDLILQSKNTTQLKVLFEKMEFKSWLRDMDKEVVTEEQAAVVVKEKGNYQVILEESSFLAWLKKLEHAKQFALATHLQSTDPLQAELVGISFAIEPGEAAYVPLGHNYLDCPQQLQREWVLNKLKPILENDAIGKIGQNIKYDMHALARYGIVLQNIAEDTMLKSYVLNSVATRHDMDSLAKLYLHYDTITYEGVAGKGAKQIPFDKVEIALAANYAAEVADIALRLNESLEPKLEDPKLKSVYREIELALIPVLWQMEEHGICIDGKLLEKQSLEIAQKLKELEQEAFILAGEQFNLSSPKQLQSILYDKLKLPVWEKTPTGSPSTAESVLQELSHDYELPKIILSHRTLSKLKSTYTDKLPLQINPQTHRVHTSYQQAVTATGRLSSTDPNLQNIPIRTEEGRRIRQAFVAPQGWKLLSADYSQVELRIMAHLSQDPGLLKAFCQGEDIHRFTASEILGLKLEAVTSEQRRSAKAINFGLIYGMSAFGLARQLDIDRSAAQAYMNLYFQRYPEVKNYMDKTKALAENQGYVETLFGRRLYLPDIRAKHVGRKRAAERTAINAPMQGTAADIIKKAMIALHQALKDRSDAKLLMQVHDELVLEVKNEIVEEIKELVVHCMQNTVTLSVPLEVGIGVGDNWDEAH